ncbi:hypothetical protein VTK73DRAFT_634 [Phialemonium thermophilum]|uniref:CAF1B/HIR1 beta-propeller domain-containing protein n=1 Tax=Phialemonium thermophilum TaxID=223376 RepID=A0ABR3VUL6_9PEZI
MNPPSVISHSRRSSFSSRRSVSPAPSLPLPAVMPMEASPKPHTSTTSIGFKNASLYANETLTSFFRRLTFTPDGSLLLTPSGQYQIQHQREGGAKPTYEVINTVYIYTRGGINKPPIAHLPGHKKPSVAVRCSPIFYTLRQSPPTTKHITIDTTSSDEPIPSLPEPVSKPSPASVMEPPPPPAPSTPADGAGPTSSSKQLSLETPGATPAGPKPAFALPYRMVYAVATQDSVYLYDTQQHTPICVVSNLHCATFTDLTWSSDGLTLLISSSDGFCSTLSFSPSELGQVYTGEVGPQKVVAGFVSSTAGASAQNTPVPTPTSVFAPPSPYPAQHRHRDSMSSLTAPSPPATAAAAASATPLVNHRAASPARSNSTSSVITTQSSSGGVITNPPLIAGQVPGITATNSGKVVGVPITTPPETPQGSAASSVPASGATVAAASSAVSGSGGTKRDASEAEREGTPDSQPKRRRIAPTLVSAGSADAAEDKS